MPESVHAVLETERRGAKQLVTLAFKPKWLKNPLRQQVLSFKKIESKEQNKKET